MALDGSAETNDAVVRNFMAAWERRDTAFILDCFMAMAILAVYFARRPIGPLRWPWFVGLSLLGGLAFSLPLYYWLNLRAIAKPDFQGS